MKKVSLVVAMFALLCIVGSAASAATIVQTANLSASRTDVNTTLSVAQFNSSLGTLNSVKFDLDSSFTSTLTWKNTGAGVGYVTWGVVDPAIKLSAPDSSMLISDQLGWIIFVGTPSAPVSPKTSGIKVLSGATYSDSKSIFGAYSQTIDSGLSAYVGGGNVELPFGASVPGFGFQVFGGNGDYTLTTVASGNLTVTYDYTAETTPVPEPSSILALVGGLGSLLAFRKRRA